MNTNKNRQIVLDTETTGMNRDTAPHYKGHKVIEIGAVEIVNRRLTGNSFHVYINPQRDVDPEAIAVHGIKNDFLQDKPIFSEVAQKFLDFVQDSDLIIHNAPFDVGFINYEYELLQSINYPQFDIAQRCTIIDTLVMARQLFPGKRNNLNALCDRFHIDNSHRTLHGALLDAEILADVYLLMTGGQTSMSFFGEESNKTHQETDKMAQVIQQNLNIIYADANELSQHETLLELIRKRGKTADW